MKQRQKNFFSGWLVRAAISFFVVSGTLVGTVHAQTWQVLETKYLRINYRNLEDLRQFDRQIKFSEGSKSVFSGFFSSSSSKSASGKTFEQQLAGKVDSLFEKVQTILDMRKPIKVNVQLYPDQVSLQEAYHAIYGRHRELMAWYIFEFNTIYLNVKDLFDGMFAHECAHAIVDNYFDTRPPRATAEILARYVDTHLKK